ncbi:MAG TPA: hypothetical protein VF762_01245 [Blastocatellia bacterium]
MSSPFIDLLRQIAGGVVIFEPFHRDARGMLEFQDLVHRLQEMERLGLVGRLYVQTRASHGPEHVDLVMVHGGLTEEGKHLLAKQEG